MATLIDLRKRPVKKPALPVDLPPVPADAHNWPVKVSMGIGVNSVAMMIGLKNRGERVDAVVFADTGSEHPETYKYIPILRAWLKKVGYPDLTIVKNASPIAHDSSLFAELVRKSILPSPAYGRKSCSLKWKVEPQRKWTNHWAPAIESWARGGYVWNLVGFDAGTNEQKRASKGHLVWPKGHWNRYPLIEWGWDREKCVEVIEAEGLPVPHKSACFMCPNCKKHEVVALAKEKPELFAKAIELETASMPKIRSPRIKGLGRNYSWREFIAANDAEKEEKAA